MAFQVSLDLKGMLIFFAIIYIIVTEFITSWLYGLFKVNLCIDAVSLRRASPGQKALYSPEICHCGLSELAWGIGFRLGWTGCLGGIEQVVSSISGSVGFISYPMFIDPEITSGFSGYIWLDTKIVLKKKTTLYCKHIFQLYLIPFNSHPVIAYNYVQPDCYQCTTPMG